MSSNTERFFIEINPAQVSEHRQPVSGDVYVQRRHNNRLLAVLSDGAGSGVKANITAGVIASMAMNYAMAGESAQRAAATIARTFSTDRKGESATFTLLDIHRTGEVYLAEAGNPDYILLRRGEVVQPEIKESIDPQGHTIKTSRFTAEIEDRIVIFTDGISDSGLMTSNMPEGWGREGVEEFCRRKVATNPEISAAELSRELLSAAESNDMFIPRHDMSCATVYFRRPRRILICTGPPFKESRDVVLADMVANYKGEVLVCGGTTAQIISRELGRDIKMNLRRDPAGLPPTSSMEGISLITEGVLTLSKVKNLLEKNPDGRITQQGTDGVVARMLLDHDIIEFAVGTRINPVHQDPDLPVELELRRNLIKGLGTLLESEFLKQVTINYI